MHNSQNRFLNKYYLVRLCFLRNLKFSTETNPLYHRGQQVSSRSWNQRVQLQTMLFSDGNGCNINQHALACIHRKITNHK